MHNTGKIQKPAGAVQTLRRAFATRVRLLSFTTAAGLALGASETRAGALQDLYNNAMTPQSRTGAADYDAKAAEQNVTTQKLRYLPQVSVQARELWVFQDIRKSGSLTFPTGRANYESTRFGVMIDQPIYDPTIRPQIDAAKARQQQVQSRKRQLTEWQTRQIVEGFLRAGRFYDLRQSSERAVAHMEKEEAAVTKSYEVKISTISDVQNVRLALASMKRERTNFNEQLHHELAGLGISGEVLKTGWVQLDQSADLASLAAALEGAGRPGADEERLRAEAAEIEHQSVATKRRSWPVLSLYGEYGYNNAAGSVFGGPQELSDGAIGLSVKWNIFDRGMNRSEARELNYRRLAKEMEAKAAAAEREKVAVYSKEDLDQSSRNVRELADLLKQYEILKDASARAYEAGKDTYINTINAYMAYESTFREKVNAQHDQLMRQVAYCAQSAGWSPALVAKIDALFVAAK